MSTKIKQSVASVLFIGTAALQVAHGQPTELFISEYVEGSSHNKAVEIFNGTGASVDLSSYKLQYYFNGSSSAGRTIALTGIVADGDTFAPLERGNHRHHHLRCRGAETDHRQADQKRGNAQQPRGGRGRIDEAIGGQGENGQAAGNGQEIGQHHSGRFLSARRENAHDNAGLPALSPAAAA